MEPIQSDPISPDFRQLGLSPLTERVSGCYVLVSVDALMRRRMPFFRLAASADLEMN